MFLLQKPSFIYDDKGKVKSWKYFKNKIHNFNDPKELLSLPVVFVSIGLFSYMLAKSI
jgi:hypothetical protein